MTFVPKPGTDRVFYGLARTSSCAVGAVRGRERVAGTGKETAGDFGFVQEEGANAVVALKETGMNEYVETRLQVWAEWSRMRVDGYYGMGGGQFGYDEPLPGMNRGHFTMPANAECMVTEQCVALLRKEHRSCGDVVVFRYRDHPEWSAAMHAQCLTLSLRTYWRRLETAHLVLWGYFAERAVGLVPQMERLRLQRRAAQCS